MEKTLDSRTRRERERDQQRLQRERAWKKERSGMRRRMKQLENRLQVLEHALAAILDPTPDFDDGWTQIEAHSSIVWHRNGDRPIARLDVLQRFGEEEFGAVPSKPDKKGVWYRPWPPATPFHEASKFVIYNRTEEHVSVRVQGWYEAR